jgi:hypothetical protein
MITVLKSFNIPEADWNAVIFSNLNQQSGSRSNQAGLTIIEPVEVALPRNSILLTADQENVVAQEAIDFLKDQKSIDYTNEEFYITGPSVNPDDVKWFARLIIPVRKNGKLIYYEGRDLTDNRPQKYLGCTTATPGIISGYEHLFAGSTPLYITEGWFDAYHLKGVAVFGNKLSPMQQAIINTSPRPKVVVPDKGPSGVRLAKQAITNGWAVSFPDIGDNCNDVTAAITKYGKLYVLKSVIDNTVSGFEAQLRLGLWAQNYGQ